MGHRLDGLMDFSTSLEVLLKEPQRIPGFIPEP